MSKLSSPSKVVNILFLLAALACVAYYIILGVTVRFGQSLDFMWLLFAFVLLLRFVLVQYQISTGQLPSLLALAVKLIHIGLILFVTYLIVIESIICSAFSGTAPRGLDYIIVLGAKVNGTLLEDTYYIS